MARKTKSEMEAIVEEGESTLDEQDLDDADALNVESEEAALEDELPADDDGDGRGTGMSMAGITPGLLSLADEDDDDIAGSEADMNRESRFEGLKLRLRRKSAQRCTIGIEVSLRFDDVEPRAGLMSPDVDEDVEEDVDMDVEEGAG